MAIIDVVKWDAAPGVFAWKYPSSELSSWTQLIVSESQEATLFKEGQSVGPFAAGRHVLSSDNYPILNKLLKIPFGRSPYTAEVWFVQKSFKLNIPWGTSAPIQLEDPKYHIMLPVRAFGQYGISVTNTSKFLIKLVGTLPCFTEITIRDYFKGIIITRVKDIVAKYLVKQNVSILQVSAYLNEISAEIQKQITSEIEEYGLKIVNFNVNGISTDEKDPAVAKLRATLAQKAEMDILGYNYQQMRSFDTLAVAANNPGAGNVMSAGMGMGMGVGMGVPMGGAFSQLSSQINTAPAKEEKENKIKCDKCGHLSPAGSKFCNACGDFFFLCPQCGTDNAEDAVVCVKCGAAMPRKCPECGAKVAGDQAFCSKCGKSLVKQCSKCMAVLTEGVSFCSKCGTKVEE